MPPPYSRAASPELGLHHYVAHAHAHANANVNANANAHGHGNGHLRSVEQQAPSHQVPNAPLASVHYAMPRSASQLVETDAYQPRLMPAQTQAQHYATVALGSAPGGAALYSTRLHASHEEGVGVGVGVGYLQSQSDQHFRYMANSSSSLSDIFVNNSCVAGGYCDKEFPIQIPIYCYMISCRNATRKRRSWWCLPWRGKWIGNTGCLPE